MPFKFDTTRFKIGMDRIVALNERSLMYLHKVCLNALEEKYIKPMDAKISLTDHSLKELRRLDHPYAVRHGFIQIHTDEPWQVHKQTVGLGPTIALESERQPDQIMNELRGKMSQFRSSSSQARLFSPAALGEVMFTFNVNTSSKITEYVEFGTKRMLARPFAEETLKQSALEIARYIKSNFRIAR